VTHGSTAFEMSGRPASTFTFRCSLPLRYCVLAAVFWHCVHAAALSQAADIPVQQSDRPRAEDIQRVMFIQQAIVLCTWPEASFASTKDETVIAILGKESSPDLLDKLSDHLKFVNDRPVVIKRFDSPEKVLPCQILLVAAEVPQEVQLKVIRQFRGKPVLLIGETAEFTRQGGCISLIPKAETREREFNIAAIKDQSVVVDLRLQKGGRFVETIAKYLPDSKPAQNESNSVADDPQAPVPKCSKFQQSLEQVTDKSFRRN
jgi:hypothetical protein